MLAAQILILFYLLPLLWLFVLLQVLLFERHLI